MIRSRGVSSFAAVFSFAARCWLTGLLLLLFSPPFAAASHPLPPEEAFPARAWQLDAQTIVIEWAIQPNYYLYRDKIRILPDTPGLTLATAVLPPGKKKRDDFFGDTEVYLGKVRVTVPVVAPAPAVPWQLVVVSQGCWSGGVCYPPLEQKLTVAAEPVSAESLVDRLLGGTFGATTAKESTPSLPPAPQAAQPDTAPLSRFENQNADTVQPGEDEAGALARFIAQQHALTVLAAFFGFGLLLALTPCVFPMIPILSGIIMGQSQQLSRLRALWLTLIYVLAMALTYALAGVVAGVSGAMVQATLQHPVVLVTFAVLFVLLALSLFGFYELQLPANWQSRLNAWAGSQRGGQAAGVAVMGVLSALIVGPCVAPPLVGALLYISQTGNALLGGGALFMLGLGMGAPLIAVGVGARELLPRSGPWLTHVKETMGVMMLALAWWLVRPVAPDSLWLFGWGALAIGVAVALGALEPLSHPIRWTKRLAKIVGLLFLAYGAAAIWGSLAGKSDPLQPLGALAQEGGSASPSTLTFETVTTLPALQTLLAASRQPVLVDIRADWCISCIELERFTFPHPEVAPLLAQVRRVKVDVTANRPDDRALLRHFGLFGPPAVLFFRPGGEEVRELRLTGFENGPRFAARLQRWLALPATNS